jgi:hypothetical protein
MNVDKIIDEILAITAGEMKNNKTRQKIEDQVLEPVLSFILEKLKPYILVTCTFMVSLTLLVISVLFLVIFSP